MSGDFKNVKKPEPYANRLDAARLKNHTVSNSIVEVGATDKQAHIESDKHEDPNEGHTELAKPEDPNGGQYNNGTLVVKDAVTNTATLPQEPEPMDGLQETTTDTGEDSDGFIQPRTNVRRSKKQTKKKNYKGKKKTAPKGNFFCQLVSPKSKGSPSSSSSSGSSNLASAPDFQQAES
jgi:hypothetical protein